MKAVHEEEMIIKSVTRNPWLSFCIYSCELAGRRYMFTQSQRVNECVCTCASYVCIYVWQSESLVCLKSFFIEFLFLSPAIPLTAFPVSFFLPFSSMKYPRFFLLIDFTPCWSFFLGYPSLYSFLLQLSPSKAWFCFCFFFSKRHPVVFQVWLGCLFHALKVHLPLWWHSFITNDWTLAYIVH